MHVRHLSQQARGTSRVPCIVRVCQNESHASQTREAQSTIGGRPAVETSTNRIGQKCALPDSCSFLSDA